MNVGQLMTLLMTKDPRAVVRIASDGRPARSIIDVAVSDQGAVYLAEGEPVGDLPVDVRDGLGWCDC